MNTFDFPETLHSAFKNTAQVKMGIFQRETGIQLPKGASVLMQLLTVEGEVI